MERNRKTQERLYLFTRAFDARYGVETVGVFMRVGVCVVLIGLVAASGIAQAGVHVRGYRTAKGSYIQPHIRTAPDNTRLNNYSTRGNTNPVTGRAGDKPVLKPLGAR